MDNKQIRVAQMLNKMEADASEACDAVAALAKVLEGAPARDAMDHAYLVRHFMEIEIAAKRVCKGIAAWRRHF